MTDARFPPPGGQAGYREPSQPSIDIEPEPLPHKKIVIASRPNDPETDDAKPPRSIRDAVSERRWLVATMLVLAILIIGAVVKVIVWPANSRDTSNSHKAR